jgi:flagellar biosynthesis protein FlhA
MAVALALLPGVPMIPFMLLGGLAGYSAWQLPRIHERQRVEQAMAEAAAMPSVPKDEPITAALAIDLVRLELGYALLPLLNDERSSRLTDQIKALRRQLAADMGFIMPPVRIQDNLQLPANSYVIRIKEIEAGRGELRPNMLLVMDPRGEPITLPGEKTVEPTFGLPAMWIADHLREEATFRGLTVVDPQTVITTHLTELMKDNMAELLSYTETQKLLAELDKDHQKLVAEMIPAQISTGGVQRVLQNLLQERISIRDLPTVLEGIAEATGYTRNVTSITEHVRARLARQISDVNAGEGGYIPLVTLSPAWEQIFAESLVVHGEDRQLSMAPSKLQEFIMAVRQAFERFALVGETPVLLTSPAVRPYVRSIIERFRPATVVMSQNEVHPKARIKTLGQI